jgi:hypothetical protein
MNKYQAAIQAAREAGVSKQQLAYFAGWYEEVVNAEPDDMGNLLHSIQQATDEALGIE